MLALALRAIFYNRNMMHDFQQTTFFGRTQELTEITQRLSDSSCRLLTLLGIGGIGKTRLAQATMKRVGATFADGVAFVALQAVDSADLLISAIAAAQHISLPGTNADSTQLIASLRDHNTLLILDNFEQLVPDDDALLLITRLISHTQHLTLLITSRLALNLQHEWLYPLGGLADTSEAAQALFAERAQRVRLDFDRVADADAIERICQLVDGMPLAIELAAAWAKSLSSAEIAAEIAQDLSILETTMRDRPARHRSLQSIFDQTWQHLTLNEQAVLARLSVFRSGFDRAAARAVAQADRRVLVSLVDQALLQFSAEHRYHLHEFIRQSAATRLEAMGQSKTTQLAHHTHFTNFLTERIGNDNQLRTLQEIARELDNVRTAINFAFETNRIEILGAVTQAANIIFLYLNRFREGLETWQRIATFLANRQDKVAVIIRINALVTQSWHLFRIGQIAKAESTLHEANRLIKSHTIEPAQLGNEEPRAPLTLFYLAQGKHKRAKLMAQTLYDTYRHEPRPINLRYALYALASIALNEGNFEQAKQYTDELMEAVKRLGTEWYAAFGHDLLASIALEQHNDLLTARHHYNLSHAIRQKFNDPAGIINLASIAFLEQDYVQAKQHYLAALSTYRQIANRPMLTMTLLGLARIALMEADLASAQTYLSEGLLIAAETADQFRFHNTMVKISELLLRGGQLAQGFAVLDYVKRADLANGHQRSTSFATAYRPPANMPQLPDDPVIATSITHSWLQTPLRITSPSPPAPSQSLIDPLTERELEVLSLIMDGMTNPQIAHKLVVSLGTIKSHCHNIYSKLGVNNRTQAAKRARELRLLDNEDALFS